MEWKKDCSSYYSVLGVSAGSSDEQIRRAYRKLAMQWHPDKWTRNPSLVDKANQKFQQIQQAYSVLSDPKKRTMYDAGLYDPQDEEDEDFTDFLQEMASLMQNARKEEKKHSFEDIQSMFWDLMQSFETPIGSGFGRNEAGGMFGSEEDSGRASKRVRVGSNPLAPKDSQVHVSG